MLFAQQFCNAIAYTKPIKAIKTHSRKQSETLPQHLPRYQYLQYVANALGWVPSNAPCNICGGYYKESMLVSAYPHPAGITQEATRITARGPVTFTTKGVSVLQDHVVVIQSGRIVKADKAYIYRHSKTGKITKDHSDRTCAFN